MSSYPEAGAPTVKVEDVDANQGDRDDSALQREIQDVRDNIEILTSGAFQKDIKA